MRSISTICFHLMVWLSFYTFEISGAAVCSTLSNSIPQPSMLSGFKSQLVATGLSSPRTIIFDKSGNIIVLARGTGIVRIVVDPNCLTASSTKTLVADSNLNHGLAISLDGKTIYASDTDAVYQWAYDAAAATVSNKMTIITGMTNGGHQTRSLLISKKSPGTIIVSRGSDGNIDLTTTDISNGKSQIKMFTIKSSTQDFTKSGIVLGWGLRNSVGLVEDDLGGIWSNENSGDNVQRNGVDIHENNPAEELNYHGLVTDTTPRGNYGYPVCFALWDPNIPNRGNLKTGDQFVFTPNSTFNDTTCAQKYIPPKTVFLAHSAPLGLAFDSRGHMWVTLHGSWDRSIPAGYRLAAINFWNHMPLAPSSSQNAYVDVMKNANMAACPDNCFKPVSLAWDSKNRLFMTADNTGQIYVITRSDGSGM